MALDQGCLLDWMAEQFVGHLYILTVDISQYMLRHPRCFPELQIGTIVVEYVLRLLYTLQKIFCRVWISRLLSPHNPSVNIVLTSVYLPFSLATAIQ